MLDDFNPHRHKGGDLLVILFRSVSMNFNPHRHKGGDRGLRYWNCLLIYFNPHRHKGGDCFSGCVDPTCFISILTATRAVTFLP